MFHLYFTLYAAAVRCSV